jgi:hypothetical protein
MDGHDLLMILAGQIGLDEFLRHRHRLAEEGIMFLPFSELFKGPRRK